MPATGYLFQMAGGVPLVTAPAEIDTTTAESLRAILDEWQSRGHTTVVVDLTATRFCDSAGLQELVYAHLRAVADGGALQLEPWQATFAMSYNATLGTVAGV